jgi:hypothetical protein
MRVPPASDSKTPYFMAFSAVLGDVVTAILAGENFLERVIVAIGGGVEVRNDFGRTAQQVTQLAAIGVELPQPLFQVAKLRFRVAARGRDKLGLAAGIDVMRVSDDVLARAMWSALVAIEYPRTNPLTDAVKKVYECQLHSGGTVREINLVSRPRA